MGSQEEELEHNSSSSSSGEEDGDEQWKAAINAACCPLPPSKLNLTSVYHDDDDEDIKPLQPQALKHYQIKAQKALDDILEKSLVMVKDVDPINIIEDNPVENEGGIRLFKQAPIGIVFDHRDKLEGPKKKPRILPGEEIDEKSKKFKRRLQSVVVEGMDILESAKNARQKSRAKLEAKEMASREAAKREEERVAQLKEIRGERWLPSVAREMQIKGQGR